MPFTLHDSKMNFTKDCMNIPIAVSNALLYPLKIWSNGQNAYQVHEMLCDASTKMRHLMWSGNFSTHKTDVPHETAVHSVNTTNGKFTTYLQMDPDAVRSVVTHGNDVVMGAQIDKGQLFVWVGSCGWTFTDRESTWVRPKVINALSIISAVVSIIDSAQLAQSQYFRQYCEE